jgi:hypothetical protein
MRFGRLGKTDEVFGQARNIRLAGHDDVHLALHHLRRQRGEAADLAAREPPFDREVAPLQESGL